MRKEFIDSVPPITIREGHVYVAGADGDYVWTPGAFLRFCEIGRRRIIEWEAARQAPMPIKPGRRKLEH